MNILFCIDDNNGNYTRHLAVTILSLLKTNKNEKINIYIFSSNLSEENQKELKRIVKKYNKNINFIIKKDLITKNIKSILINARSELTYATFYRLFLNNIKDELDRILYLDCDILINKNISKLYNQNLGGNIIAGGLDTPVMKFIKKRDLSLENYINAGVILFDVDKFKEINLENEILKANKKYGKYIISDDQDYINLICENKIKINDYKFNCLINRSFGINYKDAFILHLTNKPYKKFSRIPTELKNKYNQYLKETKWNNFVYMDEVSKKDYFFYPYNIIQDILTILFGKVFGYKGEYYVFYITNLPIWIISKIIGKIKKY